jgi:hypothetical protein
MKRNRKTIPGIEFGDKNHMAKIKIKQGKRSHPTLSPKTPTILKNIIFSIQHLFSHQNHSISLDF